MAFDEALDLFFDQDDFAVPAVIKTDGGATVRTISVIFNDPRQDVAVFDAEIESNLPFVQCKTSDLAGVTLKHTLTVAGVVYRITAMPSDGTGVSTVQLRA